MIKNTPYIIAEIGINHEGRVSKAKKLIYAAKRSNADAVKFQVFKPETLAREHLKKSFQQKKYISKKISLAKMWKKMSLNYFELQSLKKLSESLKIDFICSVFDKESLEKVLKLNIKTIKVASSDITDLHLLNLIKKSKKKVILSTGLSNELEIRRALKILGKQTTILHCVSSYPCPVEKANLNRIISLKDKFNINVGYSDHTIGNNACYLALMLGAKVVEKHFTTNKNLKGADHMLSADEKDLTELVQFAKNMVKFLGKGQIKPSKFETKNKHLFRKGLYYSDNLNINNKIKIQDIAFARPETKFKTINYKKILGKKLNKNVNKFEEINIKDFIK